MSKENVINFPGQKRQWTRNEVACKLEQAKEALAKGDSEAEVSALLEVSRTTLRYWLLRKEHIDGSEVVADFFETPDGVALLHKIVMAIHFSVMYSEHGIRGVCAALELSGISRFVASSYGAQQQVAEQVEEQIVTFGDRQFEIGARTLAKGEKRRISLVEDENFHAGKPCLIGIEPVTNFIVLETHTLQRDALTWMPS